MQKLLRKLPWRKIGRWSLKAAKFLVEQQTGIKLPQLAEKDLLITDPAIAQELVAAGVPVFARISVEEILAVRAKIEDA
jgi:hypothetical protein